jgi:thioesterase domain-containing protein
MRGSLALISPFSTAAQLR